MASDAPTHSIFALIAKRPGDSFEFFKDYYENSHIPMVNKLIGGEKYISTWTRNYFHQSQTDAESIQGYESDKSGTWDFDVITQITPKNQKAFEELWEKFKEVGEVIAKDEANFSDRERSKVYFVADVKAGF